MLPALLVSELVPAVVASEVSWSGGNSPVRAVDSTHLQGADRGYFAQEQMSFLPLALHFLGLAISPLEIKMW